MKDTYEATCPHVCIKGEWIPSESVEFVDISEDFQGYDIMTFKHEGKEYKSKIQIRPR